MMREELSEKVETVFAEEYAWPLALAVLLLILEASIGEAPKRASARMRALESGPGHVLEKAANASGGGRPCARVSDARSRCIVMTAAPLACVVACAWDPSRPFDREAPPVKDAIAQLDAGDATAAARRSRSTCRPARARRGASACPTRCGGCRTGRSISGSRSFKVGESFGARFGDEEVDAGLSDDVRQKRAAQIACALEIAQHVASDDDRAARSARARPIPRREPRFPRQPTTKRPCARTTRPWRSRPACSTRGDPVGRDAAWNRAIALRRIEDQKDAGNDAAPPPGDSRNDPRRAARATRRGPTRRRRRRGGGGDSGSRRLGARKRRRRRRSAAPAPDAPTRAPLRRRRRRQDERVLDQLENAPTVQEEDAKRRARTTVRCAGWRTSDAARGCWPSRRCSSRASRSSRSPRSRGREPAPDSIFHSTPTSSASATSLHVTLQATVVGRARRAIRSWGPRTGFSVHGDVALDLDVDEHHERRGHEPARADDACGRCARRRSASFTLGPPTVAHRGASATDGAVGHDPRRRRRTGAAPATAAAATGPFDPFGSLFGQLQQQLGQQLGQLPGRAAAARPQSKSQLDPRFALDARPGARRRSCTPWSTRRTSSSASRSRTRCYLYIDGSARSRPQRPARGARRATS